MIVYLYRNIKKQIKMETLVIQINNNKAYKLLADLEDLNILKVIKRSANQPLSLSEKYAGKLSPATTNALQDYVKQSREEWNSNAI
jgi:ribosomal protein L12E/L44/L45/RPP1/RPP2